MSEFNYARPRATAERLIRRFGQPGTLRRAGAPGGDPWNPTPGADADYPCRLVETDYDARDVDGSLVLMTDKRVLVAPGLEVEPQNGDRLLYGGKTMQVVSAKRTRPGETTLMYEIQAREG